MITATASLDSGAADPSPLLDGPAEAPTRVLLAHGAGQGADAPLAAPAVICQGTRDPCGAPQQVADYPLSGRILPHWIEHSEHSFKPRKKSGRNSDDTLADAARAIEHFHNTLLGA